MCIRDRVFAEAAAFPQPGILCEPLVQKLLCKAAVVGIDVGAVFQPDEFPEGDCKGCIGFHTIGLVHNLIQSNGQARQDVYKRQASLPT